MENYTKKELLGLLFYMADYDYRKCKDATVSFMKHKNTYKLLPMLDKKNDIMQVIEDLQRGGEICPF